MGTSNSYGGPGGGTPLVPSWIGAAPTDAPVADNSTDTSPPDGDENSDLTRPVTSPAEFKPNVATGPIGLGSTDRFRDARSNFTRFARSGGSNRAALGRAVSSYVSKSSGGARTAAQRMGSTRKATVQLIRVLGGISQRGIEPTLRSLNFSHLIGKPVEDVFAGLVDYICPDGGNVDEGIARNAFIETIAELAEQGVTNLTNLNADQVRTIIEIFATNAIEARLCNDIGSKVSISPENIEAVIQAQEQLHDFISRCVSDALSHYDVELRNLNGIDTAHFVDIIYEECFKMMETLGNNESENE